MSKSEIARRLMSGEGVKIPKSKMSKKDLLLKVAELPKLRGAYREYIQKIEAGSRVPSDISSFLVR